MKKIKVAVIGVGNIGHHHARIYSGLQNVNLVGICDIDKEKGEKIARKYNCLFSDNYLTFVQENKIEAVSIAVPTLFHYKVACDLLKIGIHVLVEKPIATTLSQAREMMKLAEEKKLKFTVGHVERFNPVVVELKKNIERAKLGKIISINIKRVGEFPNIILSENVILDLAIHDIDIVNYLLGIYPEKIFSIKLKNLVKGKEDCASILLKYGKTSVFIEVNWVTPVKIRTLDITGTKAYVQINYIDQKMIIYKGFEEERAKGKFKDFADFLKINTTKVNVVKINKEEPLKKELENFIGCILNNREPEVSAFDAYKALEIALKI